MKTMLNDFTRMFVLTVTLRSAEIEHDLVLSIQESSANLRCSSHNLLSIYVVCQEIMLQAGSFS